MLGCCFSNLAFLSFRNKKKGVAGLRSDDDEELLEEDLGAADEEEEEEDVVLVADWNKQMRNIK